MEDTEDYVVPDMTVMNSRGFQCFKCLRDGTVPLYVLLCGHCAHRQCVQRVWHDYVLFLGRQIYCNICGDTFNIRDVYRKPQRGSYHPRRPRRT